MKKQTTSQTSQFAQHVNIHHLVAQDLFCPPNQVPCLKRIVVPSLPILYHYTIMISQTTKVEGMLRIDLQLCCGTIQLTSGWSVFPQTNKLCQGVYPSPVIHPSYAQVVSHRMAMIVCCFLPTKLNFHLVRQLSFVPAFQKVQQHWEANITSCSDIHKLIILHQVQIRYHQWIVE